MAIRNQLLTQTERTMIAFTIDYYIFLLKFEAIEQQVLRFENYSNFDSKLLSLLVTWSEDGILPNCLQTLEQRLQSA